jgi:2-(1,2-epoxy-1,2-dihydrophenyl)acetyl-CoA isomerase
MSNTILVEQSGCIATLTFNRPALYNAMNEELILAFCAAAVKLRDTPGIRVLILKGAGKAFLAGGDVGVFHQNRDTMAVQVIPMGERLHEGVIALRDAPFPVIAQIQGACAGAGLSIALSCDFAIASEAASFNTAYAKIGLSPDGGSTFFLPRLVGLKKATELVMLADSLSASEAKELGLVNRVVSAESLESEVSALAARLAAGPTQAYARAKRLLNQSFSTPIATHLGNEIALFAECAATDDFKEGVSAFVEKRKPVFVGN